MTGNDCECAADGTPGVLFDDWGIQRCDLCERFEGDLDAAAHIAELFGGEVWYYTPDENGDDPIATRWDGNDDAIIAEETDPWVLVDGRAASPDVLAATRDDSALVRRIANTLYNPNEEGVNLDEIAAAARTLATL